MVEPVVGLMQEQSIWHTTTGIILEEQQQQPIIIVSEQTIQMVVVLIHLQMLKPQQLVNSVTVTHTNGYQSE